KELKEAKRQLADEILDHRIDIAALEIAAEIYHFDHVALKKGNVAKSGMRLKDRRLMSWLKDGFLGLEK
ncbi:MAG: hypothetical protein IKJ89_07310, partial [Kiritimatiellae bacterium]|nr:hypothetical protein [Kiritimatiellia bacterium]